MLIKSWKEPPGGCARGPAQFLQRATLHLSGHLRDFLHVRRLASFAAIGHRSKIRTIRFQHELVERRGGQCVADILRVFNVTMPVKLTREPAAVIRRMAAGSFTKQWNTPRILPTNGC